MEQPKPKVAPSFTTKNKDILVVGGVIIVLSSAAIAYYYMTKKKDKNKEKDSSAASTIVSNSSGTSATYNSPPFVPVNTGGSSSSIKSIVTRSYPIKLGSRHADVKVLQRYLKIYKEDLGKTGAKRDGVDGIFGPKTLRAAQKRLNKTIFTQADIAGMRKTLLSLGK
tara:strand:+ start:5745 stop:6245 length:501 start_codon:yes stop_codon:yes gene_type:complete